MIGGVGPIAAGRGSTERVQYYLADPGLTGAELQLLAARGAILAHRRFRGHPGYARWHAGSAGKIVLRAEAAEIAVLARAHDGLTIPEPPDEPRIAVFRPRSRSQASFASHLKLFSGRIGPSVRADWPDWRPLVTILFSADRDVSAGKLAAQVGHAALELQSACGRLPKWSAWLAGGLPLALVRAPGSRLAELVAAGLAHGVADEGRTELPPGSLVAAATPPGDPGQWLRERDLELVAVGIGRAVAPAEERT